MNIHGHLQDALHRDLGSHLFAQKLPLLLLFVQVDLYDSHELGMMSMLVSLVDLPGHETDAKVSTRTIPCYSASFREHRVPVSHRS